MKFFGFAILALSLLSNISFAAPAVYSGYAVSFEKVPGADPYNPANQDIITSDVIISRGSTAGIFNAAVEASFTIGVSPAGTAWAFKNNNPGQTVEATNWPSLTFEDWTTALGGAGNLATNILDGEAVLHLVDRDIYLDIRFTSWGQGFGSGGSFSYERAEVPLVPEPGSLILAALGVVGVLSRAVRVAV